MTNKNFQKSAPLVSDDMEAPILEIWVQFSGGAEGDIAQCTKYLHIKSTTVYAPRRNWDSPQPPTRRLVCPLPPVSGGRGTLAGEKGVGRVPIPTRGIHCGTLFMYVLCAYAAPRRVNNTRA